MPSTATTRNRLEKQATGENTNTWGSKLNATAFDLIDFSLDGRTNFTLSGTKTLTSVNFAADEARARFLDITSGTGGTVTIPAVEKWYIVRNNTSGSVIFTSGGPTTATVAAAQIQIIVCDGAKVYTDTTVMTATASAAAAAASAASINDANLVHLAGSETITGAKTFNSAILADGGIRINGQTLTGLTATGKSLAEAASASAALTVLGVSTYAKTLLDDPDAATARATLGLNIATATELSSSLTSATPTTVGSTGTMPTGSIYRVTLRGRWSTSNNATGLGFALASTGTLTVVGDWRVWQSPTAYTEGPVLSPLDSKSFPNGAAIATFYEFEVDLIVSGITTATLTLQAYNTNAVGTVLLNAGTVLAVERLA